MTGASTGDRRTSRLVAVLAAMLMAALLSPGPVGGGSSAAAAEHPRWGRATAPHQKLKPGCRFYRYHYRVNVPTDEWMIEVYLVNRRGKFLGNNFYWSDFHADRGRGRFRVCRRATHFGVHRMRMKVTWFEQNHRRTAHEAWVKPYRFRLTRR